MQLQDSQGRVIADNQPRQLRRQPGWALQGADGSRARLCDKCEEMRRPYHRHASICITCWSKDYERAMAQRQAQVRGAYWAAVERGEAA